MQYFVSFDWFLEITRQRLTEIYDKELVDRMIPFRQEDYFFNNTNCKCNPTYISIVISDEELKEAGRYEPNANIYDIDEDLLYFRRNDQPKAKKMNHFEHQNWHQEEYMGTMGGIGSNCWSIAGHLSQSGKPILACDPHLAKQMQALWYLAGLTWKESLATGKRAETLDEQPYIVGAAVVGLPIFTYGRSP